MVSEDRQRVIETNRSLRVIKNELESLLEKGAITDSAFDSIHSLLPAESPLSGAAATGARSTSAPSPAPTPANNDNNNNNPAAPPSYAQSTASPPSLPQRNPTPAAAPPDKPVLVHARALYRYAAADGRDLAFERDDRLAVHEYMNADWWMGRNLRTGQEGIFPRNYVVVEAEHQKGPVPPAPAPAGYHPQPQYAPPPQHAQQHYPVNPVPVGGYPAPPPQGQAAAPYQQPQQQQQEPGSKIGEQGKKIGKKLGNAAIFGAGATIGSNIVNKIF